MHETARQSAQRRHAALRNEGVWIDNNGKRTLISNMDEAWLQNVLDKFNPRRDPWCRETDGIVLILTQELERRMHINQTPLKKDGGIMRLVDFIEEQRNG